MNLRTIPMVLTVELAKCHKGDNLLRRLAGKVISRADEITELLSYYVKANNLEPKFVESKGGHNVEKKVYKLSNQLRKGIADSFFKFDEYQFAKYNRDGEIKLRDALFLTHPKTKNRSPKVAI
jgi:TROVE domain.